MIKKQASVHIKRLIVKFPRFFSDIAAFQHRDTLLCSLCLRSLLIFLQRLCSADKLFSLVHGKTVQVFFQFFRQRLFFPGRESL